MRRLVCVRQGSYKLMIGSPEGSYAGVYILHEYSGTLGGEREAAPLSFMAGIKIESPM